MRKLIGVAFCLTSGFALLAMFGLCSFLILYELTIRGVREVEQLAGLALLVTIGAWGVNMLLELNKQWGRIIRR